MNITKGKISKAQKILVYGPEGVGKTTFASQFPEALFIDTEGGTTHLDVARLDAPTSWGMLMAEVAAVKAQPECCKTLVIDTADWAERLCIEAICAKHQVAGLEDFGWGKGYTYLAEEFGRFLNLLSDVIEQNITVVVTAHAVLQKIEQPEQSGSYDHWTLKLQRKTAPLLKEWADAILFANYEITVLKEDGKARARGGSKRVMYTSHTATWDAKNRHDLPEELPFEYAAIASAITTETEVPVAPTQPQPPARPAQATPVTPSPPPKFEPVVPEHLKPLYQLMEIDGISEVEIVSVVNPKGYVPAVKSVTEFPPDFVKAVLIAAWSKVKDEVLATRPRTETIPYNEGEAA
ncbi:MAG: ATP-binding protein [Coriobacteriales bacterium]|nr:ATP-binding protein [Coriobacteriales bacterium]